MILVYSPVDFPHPTLTLQFARAGSDSAQSSSPPRFPLGNRLNIRFYKKCKPRRPSQCSSRTHLKMSSGQRVSQDRLSKPLPPLPPDLEIVGATPAHDSEQNPEPKNGTSSSCQSQSRRAPLSRPTCTHVTMSKLYAVGIQCSVCGREPSTGFVYSCEQDSTIPRMLSVLKNRKRLLKGKKRTSAELDRLGFNPSIIFAAGRGHYTHAQLDRLKDQKRHVKSVITKTFERHNSDKANKSAPPSPQVLQEKLEALHFDERQKEAAVLQNGSMNAPTPERSGKRKDCEPEDRRQGFEKPRDGLPIRISTSTRKSISPCEFKCCHACRPAFRDRSFISFEDALNDTYPVQEAWEPNTMPVIDAHVLRTIGLRSGSPAGQSGSFTSEPMSLIDEDFAEANSANGYPLSRQKTRVEPSSLADMIEPCDNANYDEYAAANQPTPTSAYREIISKAFENSARRRQASMAGESQTPQHVEDQSTSSINPSDVTPEDHFSTTRESSSLIDAMVTPLPSSDDNELEEVYGPEEQHVTGGVALTEEAVETHSPDILMSA